jgi:hypothetical protein
MFIRDICPYPRGTLSPTHMGHMPIDLYQEKKYTLYSNKKKKNRDIRPQVKR